MNTAHCEHCFRRERGGLLPQISGPIMTRHQYVCRICGESVYLGYTIDDEGNPIHEEPGAGHLYASSTPGGACDRCGR